MYRRRWQRRGLSEGREDGKRKLTRRQPGSKSLDKNAEGVNPRHLPDYSSPPTTEVIRDPLWDNIRVDHPALLALDTPAVQRLRYIRQVGHSFLVYPGATHTRFEHALGAYHLTRGGIVGPYEL
jgi:hypothetical protein